MMDVSTGERPAADAAVDLAAIRAVYEDHAADVFAFFARRVGRDLAEDLLADTFRVVLESYGSYDAERGAVRVWLFGVAANLLRRHWRTEERHLRALAHIGSQRPTVLDPLLTVPDRIDAESESARLLCALAELGPDDREVLLLRCWEELSSADVAAVLNITPGAVRTRLHRIRTQLRAAIDDVDTTHPEGTTR